MATYGDSGQYSLAISTAETGTPAVPSGNIAYLQCEKVKGMDNFDFKVKVLPSGKNYAVPLGKYKPKVNISNARIIDTVGNINSTLNFLRGLQTNGGGYLWAYHSPSSTYLALGYLNETETSYLQGYVKKIEWVLEGVDYFFSSIKWIGSE